MHPVGRLRLLLLSILFAVMTACLPARPVAAQTDAQPGDYVVLNPNGGESATDGLEVWVGPGAWNVKRNGQWQIFNDAVDAGLAPDDAGIAALTIGALQVGLSFQGQVGSLERTAWGDNTAATQSIAWNKDLALNLLDATSPTYTAVARMTVSYEEPLDAVLVVTTTYTAPNQYVDVTIDVEPTSRFNAPRDIPTTMQLYVAADWFLDGNDEGPGVATTDDNGNRMVGQYNATAFGGFVEMPGSPWTSYMAGDYLCAFGYQDAEFGCRQGPFNGSPYSNTIDSNPSFVEGVGTDAGTGAHWELPIEGRSVIQIRYAFDDSSRFISAEAPQCSLTPDMAVNPQFIELLPNGSARVEVTLRNLCKDKPYNGSDLLISVNDGLTVIDGSPQVVRLGSRAAVQGLALRPGETRTFFVVVQAGDVVPAGPTHISELYNSGRVVSRIDGVFLAPAAVAPTTAPVPVAEPAVPPAEPAAPAPLPAALPNTAGEQQSTAGTALLPLTLLLLVGAALGLAGRARQR